MPLRPLAPAEAPQWMTHQPHCVLRASRPGGRVDPTRCVCSARSGQALGTDGLLSSDRGAGAIVTSSLWAAPCQGSQQCSLRQCCWGPRLALYVGHTGS